jgi:hypothetical protein
MARIGVCLAALVLVVAVPVGAHPLGIDMAADASAPPIAATNHRLVGLGSDRAPFMRDAVSPLRPNLIRIDAGIDRLYPAGPAIDEPAFDGLAAEVDAALSIPGAEPVVILSYMPRWLAKTQPFEFRDPTRLPPRDVGVWRSIVGEVASRLHGRGVQWFEAWNEPDFPGFWQGSIREWLQEVFEPSGRAVAAAGARYGGCACLFPDPAWVVATMAYARAVALPIDFVSWHYYGNYPFIGPDGREPGTEPLAPLGQRNPAANAASFSEQIEAVRAWRDAIFAGAASLPELWIDEWNLSAGGFDRRHDTAEGAAFDTAVLVEMQRAGLDRSAFFRSVDPAYGPDVVPASPELYGGWGLVGRYGTVKPAWTAFAHWQGLGTDILAISDPASAGLNVSALVARAGPDRLQVLAANFADHTHAMRVRLSGLTPGDWVVGGEPVHSDGTLVVERELPAGSEALFEITRTT